MSPNIIKVIKCRRLRWAGHVARMEEGKSTFKILAGKPTGKRPLWRPRRRWEHNIRMDLEEIGINAGNWVNSAQGRNYWKALVNAALNIRVPLAMELVKSMGESLIGRPWHGRTISMAYGTRTFNTSFTWAHQ